MNCIDCRYSLLKDGHSNCTYEEGDCIKVSVLEKENAKLKEHHKSVCDTLTNTHRHIREQLTKSKEIIKGLLELGSIGDGDYTYVAEAEQFLKESEK